jgi:hypothetical protein
MVNLGIARCVKIRLKRQDLIILGLVSKLLYANYSDGYFALRSHFVK